LVEQADLAAYMIAAARSGDSPALRRFQRLRAGSESAVPTAAAPTGGGALGRLGGVLGTNRVTARSSSAARGGSPGAGEDLVPAVDRDTLLARLRSVRQLFD